MLFFLQLFSNRHIFFTVFYSSSWLWILLLPVNNQTLDITVIGKTTLHTYKASIKKCPNLLTILPHSNIWNTAVKELWCFDDIWQALICVIMKSALGSVFTSLSPKFTRVRSLLWQSGHFMQISVNENLLPIHSSYKHICQDTKYDSCFRGLKQTAKTLWKTLVLL